MTRRRRTARERTSVHRRRLVVLALVVTAGYGGLVARALQLQALDADWLAQRAQVQRRSTMALGPLRGEIVDRHGNKLAISAEVSSVSASPKNVENRLRTARALAAALELPADRIGAQLDPSRGFAWIARWVTPEQATRVQKLDLPGVRLQPERKRFYPSRGLAASYLGFAGRDGEGLSGIELAFDRALRGASTRLTTQRDGRGNLRMLGGERIDLRNGARIVLALDSSLQRHAEKALAHALEKTGAEHISLVAIDPRNGDVLVVAEAPGFDPNRFWEADPGAFRTRAFVDGFEPGSTLKPFAIALALEAQVVTPGEEFDCENGSWRVRDRTIRDWKPYGVLNVADIVRLSSNIGAAKIANKLGSHALVDGLQTLGFGSSTGSGFPGEVAGVVHSIREAQAVERANLAFGQGLTVTTLQLAASGAVLANGGRAVRPRLALRVEGPQGTIKVQSGLGERVVSEDTAETMLHMMRDVVANGTGSSASIPLHDVAGKTGTAQKVVDGRYSDHHYVASFLGIVPVDDPQLVIAVVVDEPSLGAHTGGGAAAPIFRSVAKYASRGFGGGSL